MNKILSAKITLSAPILLALVLVLVGLLAFSNTPGVRADGGVNPNTVPSLQSINVKWLNGIQAAKLPAANKLVPLNSSGKFPASVMPKMGFVQTVTALNISPLCSFYCTTIDNPLSNGHPNAILIVTPNYNPGNSGASYDTHPLGVWYDGNNWEIFHEDLAPMVVDTTYNVFVAGQ